MSILFKNKANNDKHKTSKKYNLTPFMNVKKHEDFREFIDRIALDFSQRNAFILKTSLSPATYKYVTYSEYRNDICNLSAYLAKNFNLDEPIAVTGKNSYRWFLVYMSVLYAGGTIVPLDKELPASELQSSLDRSKSKVLFHDDAMADLMSEVKTGKLKKLDFIAMSSLEDMLQEGTSLILSGFKEHIERKIDPDAANIILFTSGTTSMSKAVLLSHRNILSNVYDGTSAEDFYESDVTMAFLPYHHTFGSTGQIVFLSVGACTTYCDGLRYIQKNLKEYKVTVFFGVPLLIEAIYKKIIANVKKQNKERKFAFGALVASSLKRARIDIRRKMFKEVIDNLGGDLRFLISGASAINPNVIRGFNAMGIQTVQGYGMTETSPMISAENKYNMRSGSVGKAMPSVEVALSDVKDDGVGELIVRGPNVTSGYYENPEETSALLRDGWLHTGDLATIDKDGFIFIRGRKKNVIVLKNGKNVFPEEIETLLLDLPFVEECFVFSERKDNKNGELAIGAKIVYKADYMKEVAELDSIAEIEKFIKEKVSAINSKMPVYKRISRLVITDVPMIKTTTQKVKRYEEMKSL